MIQAVGEDGVAATRERGQDREVREIAAREKQRARIRAGRDEGGELALERLVRRLVADDKVRRARANAEAAGGVHAASTSAGALARPR